jgi:hypothetical protein
MRDIDTSTITDAVKREANWNRELTRAACHKRGPGGVDEGTSRHS